jgi:glutaredoxin
MPALPPRVTLLSRVGCHLCDDARAVLASVAADSGVAWEERDVDADPLLAAEYGDRVPVVMIDGREHAYWRVDEPRLRAALAGERRW